MFKGNFGKVVFIALLVILPMRGYSQGVRWMPGYLVNNNNEVIKGHIYLPFTTVTSGLVVAGIDLEWFYSTVEFFDGETKVFEPDDIRSFGFTYSGLEYKFVSNLLLYKSIIKSDRSRQRFLQLEYKGAVTLFNDCVALQHDVPGVGGGRNIEAINYKEYYLYSEANGLQRLEIKKGKSLEVYLLESGVDEEFICDYPGRIKIRNIKAILISYDEWLKEHGKEIAKST